MPNRSETQKRRETKRRLASGIAKYLVNPTVRGLFRGGLPAPGTAILETIGRKSGQPRRNPVTNGLDDGVFWIAVRLMQTDLLTVRIDLSGEETRAR